MLDFVFFSVISQEISWKNISRMTYFVSFGTQTLTQSITIMGTLSVLCLYDAEADVDDCDGVVLVVDDCDGVILVAGVFHGRGRADAGGNQSVPG